MALFSNKPTASSIDGNELLWLVDDPSGTPADVKASVDATVARAFALPGFSTAADARIAAAAQTPDAPIIVGSSTTRPLAASDFGKDVILTTSTSAISISSARGTGYRVMIHNERGSDYTLPTPTGATNRFPLGASHTKLASGGSAEAFIFTLDGGTTYFVKWTGDTL